METKLWLFLNPFNQTNMSGFLTTLLTRLTPPPFHNPPEYDGLEFRKGIFVFRPAYFQTEALLLGCLVTYIVVFFYGKSQNFRKANKWLDAHLPLLTAQFSSPTNGGLTSDGFSDLFNFSTGRRNVAKLHTIFTLRPRHDIVQMIFQIGRTFVDLEHRYTDDIQLDFTLSSSALPGGCDFVWAIAKKEELRSVKSDRWDLVRCSYYVLSAFLKFCLQTFTKTTENSALPPLVSVMSEYADVTESILKTTNIATVLQNPAVLPYFRSLSITDQPRERPTTGPLSPTEREKHVILSLHAPSSSDAGATLPLVTAVFSFVDVLSKINLRPETKTKLRKVREDLDKDLKEEATREKKEEQEAALEDKKAAKRKIEEDRIARLSAAEQKKILERERKRALRKSQGKVAVRK
ncbi:hypothetical protein HGRIS_010042 [Hohenbuehelia grisea]|uniref:Coiled-coil domain-containing protein 47 n=1 Tax=Hohenbuehelia grisea TaxID=104357 RepID=A0ABR3J345_9AGAR